MFGHALNLSVASKVSPSAHVFFRELAWNLILLGFLNPPITGSFFYFDRPVTMFLSMGNFNKVNLKNLVGYSF